MMGLDRVQRDGYSLSTLATGNPDGPAILLSNSLGTGVSMWEPQRRALEATHHVIGYDTRGHNNSDTPAGPYTFDDLIDDGFAVLDHFGIDKAAWMGLSIGGMTGLGAALRAPERLTHLICACARADASQGFIQSWDDRAAIIDAKGVPALWPKTSQVWLTPGFHTDHPDQLAALHGTFKKTTNVGYKSCAAALKQLDYLKDLGQIRVPTLFIAGANDPGAPTEVMQQMAAATPGSRYLELAGAGHIANINQPAAYTAAMLDFLA